DGDVYKSIRARELWDKIANAAWSCADPGIQYDSTINEWHTCPEDGKINGSNPCSEYMFLDDTACNLASLNLIKFYDPETQQFDIEAFKHGARIWTIVLEISVLMAQFPSKEIAELSYDFRTLGLGYANIGTLLMQMGIPYTSEEGYAITGAMTAILCGESYATSAEIAKILGPFRKYEKNRDHMLRVIRNHRRAAYNTEKDRYEGLTAVPQGINPLYAPEALVEAARNCWDRALDWGEKHGFRNAQVTVIAPTGTIGLLMDCDTTGIEPDFALVKFKKLVGGGYFKIVNQSLQPALKSLGYNEKQVDEIVKYVKGHASLKGCPHINAESLKEKGFTDKEIAAIDGQLSGVFELKFAFNKFALGEDFCRDTLGMSEQDLNDMEFNMLSALGFSDEEIEAANEYVCGTMTIEGAPHLKEEHYPVFDCANKCGKKGKRFIPYVGHLRQMAAA
ncbi:MAG TPA: vitamin B12-dependent ribonucleotide reductase, partial [Candidatus Gracilibacteria bacterium]|nr:vitamin B12-dependent ribonucleotide reductase [Candidatus Gracilibacteria bacterium]